MRRNIPLKSKWKKRRKGTEVTGSSADFKKCVTWKLALDSHNPTCCTREKHANEKLSKKIEVTPGLLNVSKGICLLLVTLTRLSAFERALDGRNPISNL